MVDLIEINIKSSISSRYISLFDFKKNYCIINDKKIPINNLIKDALLRIIRTWKNDYGRSSAIDVEEFLVTVVSNNVIETFQGKGYYPKNYNDLLNFLGGLYG